MRKAVIDIGTNTCLLLIAEYEQAGAMKVIADIHSIARLGAGVDKTKHILAESYERLKKILLEHKNKILSFHAEKVTAIATSALRDAENKIEVIQAVRNDTGFEIELLSGEEESQWSYRGAMCGLQKNSLLGRVGSLDIGGGSTELSIGVNGKFSHGKSIDIGAVRIKERFLASYSDASVNAARTYIRSELKNAFDKIEMQKLIAVAGTPTALAAMKLKLQTFDPGKVNGAILAKTMLRPLIKELFSLSPRELVEQYPAIHPDRADILPSGAIILDEILAYLKLDEVQVSTHGLRYGIMIREFEKQMNTESEEWIVTSG